MTWRALWSRPYRKGPLPYLVDGANVAMYNQNFQDSKFSFNQVEKSMVALRPAAKEMQKAGPVRYCSPHYPTHFEPSCLG
jgi:hypothetical protein